MKTVLVRRDQIKYNKGHVDKVAYKPFLWYNNYREGCGMMGRQSRQMAMLFVDMESLIPENHLLRRDHPKFCVNLRCGVE